MAPTFVSAGAATSGGGGTSGAATPGMPGSVASGDSLIAVVWWACGNFTGTISTPAGWTLLTDDVFNGDGPNDGVINTYARTYVLGDTAPTFNVAAGGAGSTYIAQIIAVRGLNTASLLEQETAVLMSAADGSGGNMPGFTTTGPDRFALGIGFRGGASPSYSIGAGWTGIALTSSTAGFDAALLLARRDVPSATTVANASLNMGTPQFNTAGLSLVFNPTSATPDQSIVPAYLAPTTTFYPAVFTQASDQVVEPSFISSTTAFYTARFDPGFTPAFFGGSTQFFDATFTSFTPDPGVPDQPATLQRFSADVFPPGTLVGIWEAHKAGIDREPVGLVLSHVTVGVRGEFDVTGLADGRFYVAYALVDGKHRYLRFRYELSP